VYHVQQVFRFYNGENDFLKKRILVDSLSSGVCASLHLHAPLHTTKANVHNLNTQISLPDPLLLSCQVRQQEDGGSLWVLQA
jgi:hypothetical protein